jgi:hypothetical protein
LEYTSNAPISQTLIQPSLAPLPFASMKNQLRTELASILRPLALFAISVLAIIARGDEPQVQQFADPKHPGMLAWKVDYVLPEDAGKPEIELDYDYWDPKLEGDVFSQHRLNSTKINSTAGTLSFVILLSTKESLIALNGKEFRGKGGSLVTDRKVTIASHPRSILGPAVLC